MIDLISEEDLKELFSMEEDDVLVPTIATHDGVWNTNVDGTYTFYPYEDE